jgi:hypothetical protein
VGVILGLLVFSSSRWFDAGLASVMVSSESFADPPNSVSISVAPEQVQLPAGGVLAYQMSYISNAEVTQNVVSMTELILPDGTRKSVGSSGSPMSLSSKRLVTLPRATLNIADYTDQTGNFVLECKVLDQNGTVVGQSKLGFTVGAESQEIRFADITDRAGVRVMHHPDPNDIWTIGTGVAMADYDQDGWLDIYVVDHYGPNVLFHNNRDGTFTDVAVAAGVANPQGFGGGAAFADYDNDGDQDLYVGNFGNNVLYRNNGDGTFTDVTAMAGVQGFGRTLSVAWGDYDGDSFLDIYVANHINGRGLPLDLYPNPTLRDYLYHNNGDGTFTDVTDLLPGRRGNDDGYGFIGGFLDYDNDGDADIYLVNDKFTSLRGDVTPNFLWRNDGSDGQGGWVFRDVSKEARADIVLDGMGLGVGDYDRDGYLDMYFSNIGSAVLLRNNGDGTFSQAQNLAGVGQAAARNQRLVSWGCEFADFDNDGWEDLYLCLGYLATIFNNPLQQPNALFKNNGDGTFTNIGRISGAADPGVTRTAAMGDIDNDGFVDIFLSNWNGPSALYRNLGNQNHWLTIEARGTVSNRNGIGARVTVITPEGVRQIREIRSGSSLGAGSEIVAHFGLGSQTEVSRVEIRWPSGRMQVLENVRADQKLLVTEPPAFRH